MKHDPVLLDEVVRWLRPVSAEGVVVDATVGLGGHAAALLERNPEVRLVGIDRDPAALEEARQRLDPFGSRVRLVKGRHEELIDILQREGIDHVDCVLADLGVSSLQLDDASRGFSFRFDAPLDMRMSGEGTTAADLVNTLSESELTDLLRRFGEEPDAKNIARTIIRERAVTPILTTTALAELVRRTKRMRHSKIDPATLTFQALRIATNEELSGLDDFVTSAVDRLVTGGRLAVISFHSLEDRIVKRAIRRLEGECTCPPGLPVCSCGAERIVRNLVHLVRAGEEEVERNPRSRSARMRVVEKT